MTKTFIKKIHALYFMVFLWKGNSSNSWLILRDAASRTCCFLQWLACIVRRTGGKVPLRYDSSGCLPCSALSFCFYSYHVQWRDDDVFQKLGRLGIRKKVWCLQVFLHWKFIFFYSVWNSFGAIFCRKLSSYLSHNSAKYQICHSFLEKDAFENVHLQGNRLAATS